ncbi:hypothetical protein [Hymenobacter metallilatus]|uniref:Uncharacterized protein n=1 Tax=Hymenobacter metallilatus TaxID=2493666 RepID=A0A3R9MYR1_9BACT|nr:hypothetical protein [Hymenobacter metallilatus]RSK33937.1 hypothetical protein EI290_09535 [Hymenobacter metallilatus]
MLSAARGSEALALAITDRQWGLTPAKALQSPQLSVLARQAPRETAEALGNLLIFAAHQFNVPRNLSDMQVGLLAEDLLERYWFWRFDEFVYLCKEAIAGRWGCNYSTIDAPTVHGWCTAYAEVRDAVVEQAAREEHKARRLAEQAQGPARAADEQAYIRHLETLTDEQLQKGIAWYEARPMEPHAALRIELATAVLVERAKLELLRRVLVVNESGTGAVEASEEEYKRFRAGWVAQRERERAEQEAEQQPEAPAA